MAAPTNLREQLIRDEGLRLKPYTDSVGKLTIGYGRNLTDNGISIGEAEEMLDRDIARTASELSQALPWAVGFHSPRAAVLLNMAYNVGVPDLLKFTTFLGLVKAGRWADAAVDGRATLWARQVGPRAERLMDQLESGEWR